jgi:hypothetical protein
MTRLEKENQEAGNPYAGGGATTDQPLDLRRENTSRGDVARAEQRLHSLRRTQPETSGDPSSADSVASQAGEPPGLQPPAVGEKANAERAETGPEKKDKEIYLAEKRLSRL